MGVRTWVSDWSVYRQLTGADPLARGRAAMSAHTRQLRPRTDTAERVVSSTCPYCAVGCGQVENQAWVCHSSTVAGLGTSFGRGGATTFMRAGSDIAFLGAVINHVLTEEKDFREKWSWRSSTATARATS